MNLHVVQHAIASRAAALAMGIPEDLVNSYGEEIGLIRCLDENGQRVTAIGDPKIARTLRDAKPAERTGPPFARKDFPLQRSGWPPLWE